MTNKYLIDSSVFIGNFRQRIEAKQLIDRVANEMCTSSLVLAELLEGLERSKNKKTVFGQIREIIDSIKIYNFSLKEAKIFGYLRSLLKARGEIIGDIDLLIAATCIANDLSLVTLNVNHFKRIKGLKIFS